jgi:hypothetical protein
MRLPAAEVLLPRKPFSTIPDSSLRHTKPSTPLGRGAQDQAVI